MFNINSEKRNLISRLSDKRDIAKAALLTGKLDEQGIINANTVINVTTEEINQLENQLKSRSMKSINFKSIRQSVNNAAYKTAKGVLAGSHFVADSVAEACIQLEMKLDKDVDPTQVAQDRIRISFETRQAIIFKAKSLMRQGAEVAQVVVVKAQTTVEQAQEFVMMESVTLNKTAE